MTSACITINALSVSDNGNGTFSLHIPAKELSSEDRMVLEKLFPNLGDAAFTLLSKETLLQAIATEAEIAKPPTKKNSKKDYATEATNY